jgi:hypothetical protein
VGICFIISKVIDVNIEALYCILILPQRVKPENMGGEQDDQKKRCKHMNGRHLIKKEM